MTIGSAWSDGVEAAPLSIFARPSHLRRRRDPPASVRILLICALGLIGALQKWLF